MADIGKPIKEITVTPPTIPVPGPVEPMTLPAPALEPVSV